MCGRKSIQGERSDGKQRDTPAGARDGRLERHWIRAGEQFADHGFDLVVAAADDELAGAARELAARDVQVEPIQVDLSHGQGVDELYQRVVRVGRPLDAAALYAGIGIDETPLEQELRPGAAGRILFTSSIASTMPGTFTAVYNAAKSFVQSFARWRFATSSRIAA
jgi:short-subunit dehydrogenase